MRSTESIQYQQKTAIELNRERILFNIPEMEPFQYHRWNPGSPLRVWHMRIYLYVACLLPCPYDSTIFHHKTARRWVSFCSAVENVYTTRYLCGWRMCYIAMQMPHSCGAFHRPPFRQSAIPLIRKPPDCVHYMKCVKNTPPPSATHTHNHFGTHRLTLVYIYTRHTYFMLYSYANGKSIHFWYYSNDRKTNQKDLIRNASVGMPRSAQHPKPSAWVSISFTCGDTPLYEAPCKTCMCWFKRIGVRSPSQHRIHEICDSTSIQLDIEEVLSLTIGQFRNNMKLGLGVVSSFTIPLIQWDAFFVMLNK